MTDREARRAAGEAAVGEKGAGGAEALRLQITGRVEHFLHARPALGAFVADDDDVAGADLTPQSAHHGGVLALIDPRRAGEGQNVFVERGRLHEAAHARAVAAAHRHASPAAARRYRGADDAPFPVT